VEARFRDDPTFVGARFASVGRLCGANQADATSEPDQKAPRDTGVPVGVSTGHRTFLSDLKDPRCGAPDPRPRLVAWKTQRHRVDEQELRRRDRGRRTERLGVRLLARQAGWSVCSWRKKTFPAREDLRRRLTPRSVYQLQEMAQRDVAQHGHRYTGFALRLRATLAMNGPITPNSQLRLHDHSFQSRRHGPRARRELGAALL